MEYEKTYRNPPNPYQPIILLLEMGLLVNSVFIIFTPRFADFNAELRNGFYLQILKNSRFFLSAKKRFTCGRQRQTTRFILGMHRRLSSFVLVFLFGRQHSRHGTDVSRDAQLGCFELDFHLFRNLFRLCWNEHDQDL